MRKLKTQILVEEAHGADNSLDMVVSRRESHQFSKQNQVLRSGWQEGKAKEDAEADPLADVAQNIPGRGLGIIKGLS